VPDRVKERLSFKACLPGPCSHQNNGYLDIRFKRIKGSSVADTLNNQGSSFLVRRHDGHILLAGAAARPDLTPAAHSSASAQST
jgi:hypothetical protein